MAISKVADRRPEELEEELSLLDGMVQWGAQGYLRPGWILGWGGVVLSYNAALGGN